MINDYLNQVDLIQTEMSLVCNNTKFIKLVKRGYRNILNDPALIFDKKKEWLGDKDLNGKTIFISKEQGLGDYIFFCRYLPLIKKLANEIILASQEKGNAVKRCTELHKLAMANRAYSGFRW